jgi:methylated-DNA-[protein]-cysteine S-methyltransferase
MDRSGYTIFDTALGRCGIAWGPRGLLAVELPGRDDEATSRRIRRAFPGAREAEPPRAVGCAIEAIAGLFDGEPDDLGSVALDMGRVPEFERRVYEAARRIPPGSTLTYGELAERIGARGAAQAVGRALGRNPFPIVVPCHRVVAADGSLRGFSAPGGREAKRRMLAMEGALAPALFD